VVALLQRTAGEPSPVPTLLPVQRNGDGAVGEKVPPAPLLPPPLLSERQRRAAAPPLVNQLVGALPPLSGRGLLGQRRAEAGLREAEAVEEDLPGFPRSPAFAAWLSAQQDGEPGPPVEELRAVAGELEAGDQEVAAPLPAEPGLLSRAGSAAMGFFGGVRRTLSGWVSAVKQAFSRENRRDIGAKAPTAGGSGAPVAGHIDYALTAGQALVENPASEGAARLVGGAKAVGEVRETGGQMGQVAHSASPATTTLKHPGDFAHSFAAGGFELAHQIAGIAGIFFSALKAALDVRSLVSSVRVIRALKEARREAAEAAEDFWADPDANQAVIEMVDYAIRQKYEKVIKRAIGSAAALAALGTALAILIANPVGASLAAIIIGGLGASMLVYRIGRWAWKKWKTRSLGKKRAEIAHTLYAHIMAEDSLAIAAVRSLHLDPDEVVRAPNGPALIMRKLKSA
jgi:hypothetical protein